MTFEQAKKDTLNRLDRSKKGSIDKAALPLVNKINKLKNYYTTSSCSGRILVMYIPTNFRKDKVEWVVCSHEKVTFKQVKKALKEQKDLWFRQESAIWHIACRDIEAASKLLQIAKDAGFKRSGIMTANKRIILEIMSTEHLHLPIKKEKKILVDDDYIKIIIDEANKRLERTKIKIKKFTSSLKGL